MESFGKTIIAILLGWILGLLSPPIVELIQRPRRRREIRKGIVIELEGLRLALAVLTYQSASFAGTVDRDLLQVLECALREDKAFPEVRGVAEAVRALLELTDPELSQKLSKHRAGYPVGLKKLSMPFITAQLPSLSLFSPDFQRIALKICSRVALINEEIEMSNFNHKKTFDTSPQNHEILLKNLEGNNENLLRLCRPLIDDVNRILSM